MDEGETGKGGGGGEHRDCIRLSTTVDDDKTCNTASWYGVNLY